MARQRRSMIGGEAYCARAADRRACEDWSDVHKGAMIASSSIASGPSVLPIRVYYEDTDFSGSVYHASYLRFLERGRTEFLRAHSVDQRALFSGKNVSGISGPGCFFAVRSMNLDFLKPAHMDDELTIETAIETLGGASITMAQRILRREDILLAAKVKIALVSGTKAQRFPPDLVAKLTASQA